MSNFLFFLVHFEALLRSFLIQRCKIKITATFQRALKILIRSADVERNNFIVDFIRQSFQMSHMTHT